MKLFNSFRDFFLPSNNCANCGKPHGDWPALGFIAPHPYLEMSDQAKAERAELDEDFCVIHHDDQTDRFIRTVLFQRINDHCDMLHYGVWVSLSEKNFEDYRANFKATGHEATYFGWMCNAFPGYDSMLRVKMNVLTRAPGQRPEVIPHKEQDHPFVKDYYEGISYEEAKRRIVAYL